MAQRVAMVAPTPGMFSVDGATLEGGGQLIRMTSAISALLGIAIQVDRIRAGRSKPGLAAQHAAGVNLVAAMCSGQLSGGDIGSTSLSLLPGRLRLGGTRRAECGTAGSVTLLLQSSLPLCCVAPPGTSPGVTTRLELCGGTDVAFAPPADYARCVLLPHLNSLFGIDAQLEVRRRGFFPRGGGEIAVEVATRDKLRPFELVERGQVVRICGVAVAQGGGGGARGGAGRGRGGRRAGGRRGGVKGATGGRGGRVTSAAEEAGGASAAEEAGGASGADAASMAAGAREALRAAAQLAGVPTAIEVEEPPGGGCGEGGVLVLWAETSGGCRLGASALLGRGDSPGEVGRRAAADLAALLASGACVDEHMQDQLVLFMALADGAAPSRLRAGPLTLHTRTAIHFAEAMIGAKFTVTEEDGGGALIECEGAGYPGKTQ